MIKVAIQGELGSYSNIAAKQHFGDAITIVSKATFADVFNAISTGKVKYGLVPVENSLYGSIFETYDLLLKHKYYIQSELRLKINHHLLSLKEIELMEIEKIFSHPQALGQCSSFLQSLSKCEVVPAYDTAGSAKYLVENPTKQWAILASDETAKIYNLKILKKNIQNNNENFTRFLVISKKRNSKNINNPKSSICFELKSMPGALFKALSVFALREIDLFKIESRPIPDKPFQYRFYCDFKGNLKDQTIRNAIKHLQEISISIDDFGTYSEGKIF